MRILSSVGLLTMLAVWVPPVSAEPFLAVYEGLQCSACHTHVAGGGKRNAFGNAFAQSEMPATRVGEGDVWTGQLTSWLGIGGNLRAEYRFVDTPNQEEVSEFDVVRGTLYVEATVIPDRLSVYFDQQVAPGGSLNREAYLKLTGAAGKWSFTAGQFFLPYGLRLQDDSAFVRQVTGVNLNSSDRGLQVAFESGAWSTQFSVTNGSGGAAENDTGKQVSWVVHFVQPRWRTGVSLNVNDSDAGNRQMQNVFFGLRTGPIAWLAEVDWIRDDLLGGTELDSLAGLIEGNWLFRRGHNLKVTYDYFDPDDGLDEDHQARYSVLWEYSPLQFVQSRVGIRIYDGVPQVDSQNREEFFIELHGHF